MLWTVLWAVSCVLWAVSTLVQQFGRQLVMSALEEKFGGDAVQARRGLIKDWTREEAGKRQKQNEEQSGFVWGFACSVLCPE